tara:strand:+ start:229 stop:1050 length:822 start_codon:yes stop_codon:yes gene_type:complete
MKICGICDFRKKVSLGSLLLIINLIRINKIYKKKKSVLQIIVKKKLDKDIVNVAKSFDFIDKVELLSKIKINKNYFYFQNIKNNLISYKNQNSTVELQKYYKKYKFKNNLSFKKVLELKTVLNFNNKIKVAVHLKLDKKNRLGNARTNVWFNFFRKLEYSNTKFIMIGKDDYPRKFYNLKNLHIVSSQESLLRMLIISKKSDFFLGSASGISAINMLNKKPYIIFKHPNHHPKIFKKELNNKKKLLFQTKNQLIINNFENEKTLLKYYEQFSK